MSFKDVDDAPKGDPMYLRHDNKEGTGFMCGKKEVEVNYSDINFVADFPVAKIGWGKFAGGTYYKEWQEDIKTPHPEESRLKAEGYKRAFSLYLYSTDKGLKLWERDSAMEWSGFLAIAKAWESDAGNRGDKIPVIGYEGAEGVETANGKYYKPVFKIKDWVDRPTDFVIPDLNTTATPDDSDSDFDEDSIPF